MANVAETVILIFSDFKMNIKNSEASTDVSCSPGCKMISIIMFCDLSIVFQSLMVLFL